MLLKRFSSRNLAKKIVKLDACVVSIACTVHLVNTLEKADIKASMYASQGIKKRDWSVDT